MKTTPHHLSLYITFFFAVVLSLTDIIVQLLLKNTIDYWAILLVILFSAPVIYLVIWLTLSRYIYEKIKVIYKTIRRTKIASSGTINNDEKKNDVLEVVNREVEIWAASQEKEIAELKKLESYRREFLGNVSHELKTPITTIQGYVLTLLEGGLNDPAINKKYLVRTSKNINRLISIVNDLETISRYEAGVIQLQQQRFNLSASILDVLELMEMKALKKSIQFHFKEEFAPAIYALGDKDKIRQVLINLIDNSLKYGNEKGTTTISTFDMDDHILIEVSDNGMGIEECDLPRVFERFYRTDKSRARSQKGTGLGLAIVKHIIEAHNETIHVRSQSGMGSTFAFTLKKA